MGELIGNVRRNGLTDEIIINEFLAGEEVVLGLSRCYALVPDSYDGKQFVTMKIGCLVAPVGQVIQCNLVKNGADVAGTQVTIADGQLVSPTINIGVPIASGDQYQIRTTSRGSTVVGEGLCATLEVQ